MKLLDVSKVLGVVLAAALASSAYAQSSDTTATDTTSPKATAKANKKTDRKLGYTVRRAISKTQGVDVSNIFVRSRGGAVTLTGTVPDASQIDKAGDAAKGVTGVTSVSNKLTVAQPNGGGGG